MSKVLPWLFVCLIAPTLRGVCQSAWSVSATVAPVFTFTDYTRRYLYPDSDGQVVEPIFLNGRRWASGFSAGMSVQYTYAPGWSVTAGLWYRQTAVRLLRLPAAGEGQTSVRTRAVRLPFLLSYRSSARRLSPYFTFGPLIDFPLSWRVTAERSGESTQRLRLGADGGPVFHVLLGAGGQYTLNERYRISLQPTWAYNLGRFGGSATHDPSFELSLLTQLIYQF